MIVELTSKSELTEFLSKDPGRGVYFIGDLDDRYFADCRWWGWLWPSGDMASLALLFRDSTLLTLGLPEGVEDILRECSPAWPAHLHAHYFPEHADAVKSHYSLAKEKIFLRMVMTRGALGAPLCESQYARISPLTREHEPAIRDLLQDYPDNYFMIDDLKSGWYFGIFEDETLEAMSGVHVASDSFKVAALGNIVTRSSKRSMGYSTLCTEYLVRRLFDCVELVALNVEANNVAAVKLYKKLGFHIRTDLLMAFCDTPHT